MVNVVPFGLCSYALIAFMLLKVFEADDRDFRTWSVGEAKVDRINFFGLMDSHSYGFRAKA